MAILNTATTALVTHLVFVVLNILIVLTNVYLPRLIDDPKFQVAEEFLFVDLHEVALDGQKITSIQNRLEELFGFDNSQTSQKCEAELQGGLASPACASEIVGQLDELRNQISSFQMGIDQLLGLVRAEDVQEISEFFYDPNTDRRVRRIFAQYNVLLATALNDEATTTDSDNGKNGELISLIESSAKSVKVSLQDTALDIEQITNGLRLEESGRSGNFALKLLIMNDGFADGYLTGKAVVNVNGVEIPLRANGNALAGNEIDAQRVISSKSIIEKTFVPDTTASQEETLQLIQFMMEKNHEVEMQVSIFSSSGTISKTFIPDVQERHFELE